LQSVLASQAQVSSLHLANAHISHAVGFEPMAQVPPSSPEEPPEPPVPVVVDVVELVELVGPAAPDVVLLVPPSPLSEVSVVHAPSTAITADAAQIVMFFIVSLLAIGYAKREARAGSGAARCRVPSTARRTAPALSHVSFERVKLPVASRRTALRT
jgi:hypothetical protein